MSKKPRIINLNRDKGRYDLANLPRKKTNRKSSSFVRRTAERHSNFSELSSTTSTRVDEYAPVEPGDCSSVTHFVNPLDTIDAYKLDLINADGFMVLSQTDNRITSAIQDYDTSLGIIKTNAFHTVDCVFKSFADGCFWVAACTCSPRGQQFINSLPFKVSQTFRGEHDYAMTITIVGQCSTHIHKRIVFVVW